MPTPQRTRPTSFATTVACGVILLAGSALAPPTHASNLRHTPIVKAVQAARPSVVNIHGHKTVDGPNENGEYKGPRRVNGMGTGVVIDERGYIITNHHVIEGVKRIQVTLHDRRTYTARLVARDPQTDLAVIRIHSSSPLRPLRIGKSDDLMPGEPVVAVGNAYGYHHTVTRGIISALNRTVEVTDSQKYYDLIQTDASINPGNSGGPLLNIDGEMIGINAAVRVGAQGIGFAIPIDKAMEVAARMMRVEKTSGTWHGVMGETIHTGGVKTFKVHGVQPGSPAELAGVHAGDVIRSIGKTRIERALDIERALLGKEAGTKVVVHLDRESRKSDVQMQIASSPLRRQPSGSRVESDVWRIMGIRVKPTDASKLTHVNRRYNGGLRVLDVRSGSAASAHDIRVGDILVGMHIWETVSMDNLDYILNRAKFDDPDSVKYYVVRGSKLQPGEIPVIRR